MQIEETFKVFSIFHHLMLSLIRAVRGLGEFTQAYPDICSHTDMEQWGWDGDCVASRAGSTTTVLSQTTS